MRLEELQTEIENLISKLAHEVSTESILRLWGPYSQIYSHLSGICGIIQRELSYDSSER